jgi:hypothetical protein
VELQNVGNEGASPGGYALEDARGRPARLPEDSPSVEPGGFLVLAASLEKLLVKYPDLEATGLVEPEGSWPTLNDSDGSSGFADQVLLRRPDGLVSDSLAYFARWLGAPGVSLERVDPLESATLSSNWSPSVHERGATPLARNSLALEPGASDRGGLILPRSPYEPEVQGVAPIGWRLEKTGRLSLEIVDVAGRSVRLLRPLDDASPLGRVAWDGRDDRGFDVPTGVYLILMEGRLDGEAVPRRWRRPLVLVRGGR